MFSRISKPKETSVHKSWKKVHQRIIQLLSWMGKGQLCEEEHLLMSGGGGGAFRFSHECKLLFFLSGLLMHTFFYTHTTGL